MENVKIIRRIVWQNKTSGQKLITVPHDAKIYDGDIVEIKRVKVVQKCQICGTEDSTEKTMIAVCPSCLKNIGELK